MTTIPNSPLSLDPKLVIISYGILSHFMGLFATLLHYIIGLSRNNLYLLIFFAFCTGLGTW